MTNHSSQHSSRAGSLEDLSGSSWGALDPTGSGAGGVKSILKKGTSSNVGTGLLALYQVFFAIYMYKLEIVLPAEKSSKRLFF